MLDGILKDLIYALRSLKRSPVFVIAVVVSLALGIGANAAIFSLIDQVLLRSLPVPNPQELVILKSPGPRSGRVSSDDTDGSAGAFSYPMYKDIRDRQTAFSGLLARFGFGVSVAFNGQTEHANGELVSGNYFDVLGVRADLGRMFSAEDDLVPGQSPIVVLGHNFWVRQFGGRSDILNQQIIVNGHSLTVVGVAPARFFGVQLGYNPDVYVPMTMKAEMTPNWNGLDNHRDYWLIMMGRLKPGLRADQAQAQLAGMYRTLLESETEEQKISGERHDRWVAKPLLLQPGASGRSNLRNQTRDPLLALMALVGLVLLIACANVANLLVARATARERETAVRLAIGASRMKLVRQCLVESLLLAGSGAVAALLVARWTIQGLLQLMPPDSGTQVLSAGMDWRVLLFTFGIAITTGFLFGLVPAIEGARTDVATGLKAGTASSSASRHARIRKLLVAAQVAFTLLMVVGASLFSRTLLKLQAVDSGIQPENIIRFELAPALNGYDTARTRSFFQRLQQSVRRVPGVTNASMATEPIFADSDSSSNVTIEGYTAAPDENMDVFRNEIGPGYFSTLGVPLVAGREFSDADTSESPKVCLINQALVDRYFKGRDPIGFHITFGAGNVVPDMTIVGVVRNSKHSQLSEEQRRFIYIPYTQLQNLNRMTVYARAGMEPSALMNALRGEVRNMDPTMPVMNMKTLETQISESLTSQRLMTRLSLAFGSLSVLLAGFGIYGVLSYLVSRRTREIGIRMAVGASPSRVRWLVLREVMVLVAAGIAIGLPVAFVLGKSAQSLLYDSNGVDGVTAAVGIVTVVLLALIAGYVPTRRATRVDPMSALRNE